MKYFPRYPIFIIIIIAISFIWVIYLAQNHKTTTVCFKDFCFKTEIAKTTVEISRGLMFRESLDINSGMLFVFENEGIYPFWMKNTLIPLDIIWISKDNEVVFISENNQPCQPALPAQTRQLGGETDCPQITPPVNAKYVLEINAGQVKKIGIQTGDTAKINF